MSPEQIIRRPIILTEKANLLKETANQVVFEVARTANKVEIKDAVQKLFNVKVTGVNTMIFRGKDRRIPEWYEKVFRHDAIFDVPEHRTEADDRQTDPQFGRAEVV